MVVFPERFGEFLLLQKLAESLMAEVFLAIRPGDHRGQALVIKRPRLGERASGEAAQAIWREAEVLEEVKTPTLVALDAKGEVGGLPFVALEHVRGVALDRILARRGVTSEAAAFAIARDLLRALSALHDAGWVHADVAPSNIVVDEGGEAKLIDLGIALRVGEARETAAGKPGYVAPEVVSHKPASPAEDVYAAAVVVAECLLGRRLHPERDVAEAATRVEVPNLLAGLPLGAELGRALSLTPGDRPNAKEFLRLFGEEPNGRAELAALVADAAQPTPAPRDLRESRPALGDARAKTEFATPLVAPSSTARVSPALLAPASTSPPPPAQVRMWPILIAAALAVAVALAGGFAVGRRLNQPKGASVTLPATAPRTEIVLDGRTVLLTDPLRPIPISPGTHTLSLALRKREKDLEFVAKEGESIIIVPVMMPRTDSTPDKGSDKSK